MKKCPYCAEEIQDIAVVCPYCRRELIKDPNHQGFPLGLIKIAVFFLLLFIKACYDRETTSSIEPNRYILSHPPQLESTPTKPVPAILTIFPTPIQVFATVLGNPMMVYENPDKDSTIIDKYQNGFRVRISYRNSDSKWVKIEKGWVLTQDLSLDRSIEVLPTQIP